MDHGQGDPVMTCSDTGIVGVVLYELVLSQEWTSRLPAIFLLFCDNHKFIPSLNMAWHDMHERISSGHKHWTCSDISFLACSSPCRH